MWSQCRAAPRRAVPPASPQAARASKGGKKDQKPFVDRVLQKAVDYLKQEMRKGRAA